MIDMIYVHDVWYDIWWYGYGRYLIFVFKIESRKIDAIGELPNIVIMRWWYDRYDMMLDMMIDMIYMCYDRYYIWWYGYGRYLIFVFKIESRNIDAIGELPNIVIMKWWYDDEMTRWWISNGDR